MNQDVKYLDSCASLKYKSYFDKDKNWIRLSLLDTIRIKMYYYFYY